MKRHRISLARFELPFQLGALSKAPSDSDNEPSGESLDEMEAALPKETIFLGSVDSEVNNWTSWKVDDHYYLVPLSDDLFKWALFRITWDDNWGRNRLSPDARLSGFAHPREAARLMLRRLFSSWKIDLRKKDSSSYKELLQ